MSDAVFDTTVVAFANSTITSHKAGTSCARRFNLLAGAVAGNVRIRYNAKLLTEYTDKVRLRRNDVIELFFALLDSRAAIRVSRNNLSRQHHHRAVSVRWPIHDQHLLAAAIDGDRSYIYVTEKQLAARGADIHRTFKVHVQLV